MKNEHTRFLCQQAKKQGIKCRIFKSDESFCCLERGQQKHLVYGGILASPSSASAFALAGSKVATNEFLKINGFSILPQRKVSSLAQAATFLKIYKKIVLKPINQKQGRGITVAIQTAKELKLAWSLAHKYSKAKVVEKHYDGVDHRILVINYKNVFAIQRFPAFIIGDGKNSIANLIKQKNDSIFKGQRRKKIVIDLALKIFLKKQKLNLRSVPDKDEKIILRGTANLHTGGETKEITPVLPGAVKKEAIKIAKLLKMSVVGIDYLAQDLKKKRYIIELNADPGVQLHHFPVSGQPQEPIRAFLQMLFK